MRTVKWYGCYNHKTKRLHVARCSSGATKSRGRYNIGRRSVGFPVVTQPFQPWENGRSIYWMHCCSQYELKFENCRRGWTRIGTESSMQKKVTLEAGFFICHFYHLFLRYDTYRYIQPSGVFENWYTYINIFSFRLPSMASIYIHRYKFLSCRTVQRMWRGWPVNWTSQDEALMCVLPQVVMAHWIAGFF